MTQMTQPRPSEFFAPLLDKFKYPKKRTNNFIRVRFTSESGISIRGLALDTWGYHHKFYASSKCACASHDFVEDDEDRPKCVDKCTLYVIVDKKTFDAHEAFDKLVEIIEASQYCSSCKVVARINDMCGDLCTKCFSKEKFALYVSAKTVPKVKSVNKE